MKKFAIVLSLTTLIFVASTKSSIAVSTSNCKIMPLGDSITGSNGGNPSYRDKLWSLLMQDGYPIDFVGSQIGGAGDPDNEGHAGWNTKQIDENINIFLTAHSPNYVLFLIGTNDISIADVDATRLNQSQVNFTSTLDKIYAKSPTTKIFVATIIPRPNCRPASDICGIDARVADWNNRIKSVVATKKAQGRSIVLVDMFSEAGINIATDLDGELHPKASGSIKIANVWYKYLKTGLSTSCGGSGDRAPIAGDLNMDGKVDDTDYNLVVTNFGKTGTNIVGDINKNGKVDVFDYNTVLTNYGK